MRFELECGAHKEKLARIPAPMPLTVFVLSLNFAKQQNGSRPARHCVVSPAKVRQMVGARETIIIQALAGSPVTLYTHLSLGSGALCCFWKAKESANKKAILVVSRSLAIRGINT